MAIDCPECGESFSGKKCKCGYVVNSAGREPRPVIACSHQGCQQPAMTRDKLGANVCRWHWEREHRVEVLAYLDRHDLQTLDEKRYHFSKIASELSSKAPTREWVYRLKSKQDAGEILPEIARRFVAELIVEKESA